MKQVFACKGTILYTPNAHELTIVENGYAVVKDGTIQGVYTDLPETYIGIRVDDYGDALIIPAFSDLHIHGSQYFQRGVGMDKLLFDWLNDYTFPQEAKFINPEYANAAYAALVDEFVKHGTFHASIFTTIHSETASLLVELLESRGILAYVGKVNMDQNSPSYLSEITAESLADTERFISEHSGARYARPIITPRFAPTCSDELLYELGKLAKKTHCPMQTHLVESRAEVKFALETHPNCACDTEIYQRAGLLDQLAIFAHVIFPSERDIELLRTHECILVHCPDATTNITAGIMPFAKLEGDEMPVAIGSDIGGGHGIAIYRQIARAIQLSKLKRYYEPDTMTVDLIQAFHAATKAGGSVFGKVGSFEAGYRFDALVLDGLTDVGHRLTPLERLERFCYIGDDRNIIARYMDGKIIEKRSGIR